MLSGEEANYYLKVVFLAGLVRPLIRGFFVGLTTRSSWLFIGRGVKIRYRRNVVLGRLVRLEDYVELSGLSKNKLRIGSASRVGAHSKIIVSTTINDPGKGILIGSNVGIGEFSYIGGAGGVSIGDNTITGQYLSIHPENHTFSENELIRLSPVKRQGIYIGENVWIGAKVTILDGSKIGDSCIIAAGAVVRGEFGNNLLIGGIPAKILKILE